MFGTRSSHYAKTDIKVPWSCANSLNFFCFSRYILTKFVGWISLQINKENDTRLREDLYRIFSKRLILIWLVEQPDLKPNWYLKIRSCFSGNK